MASDARDSSSGVELFRCPTCAATLEVVDAPSVKCKYCGNSVPVPAELRPHKPQVVIQQVDFSSPQYAEATKAGRGIGCVIAVIVLIISIGAVGVGLFARCMSVSLYRMHVYALHGFAKMAFDTLAKLITRRTEPRVKLH